MRFIRHSKGMVVFLGAALGMTMLAFADGPPQGSGAGGLSAAEQDQLKDLRTQLDTGKITADEFATQVDTLLGDRPLPGPFARLHAFRGAMAHRSRQRVAERLNLTDEQRQAAKGVFQQTQRQVRVERIKARANMRLALTTEQRAKLDELRDGRFAALRGDQAAGAASRPAWRPGAIRERMGAFFNRLGDTLALTDQQKSQMRDLHQQVREQVKALHERAGEGFKALLTPEQLGLLEQWKQQHHHGQKPTPETNE